MVPALNSGPPLEESSSAMSKVANTLRSAAMRHFESPLHYLPRWASWNNGLRQQSSTYRLEGVDSLCCSCRWREWLGWGHAVTRCTSSRVSSIAGVMPGQKNDPSARDIIIESALVS